MEAEALAAERGISVAEALEGVNELRAFSNAELKEKNIKINSKMIQMMGEECIVSKKAAKLIGPPLSNAEV